MHGRFRQTWRAVILAVTLSNCWLLGAANGQEETAQLSFDLIDKEAVPAADANEEKLMSFHFRFAPWEDVLTRFAERAGLTLDLNEVPKGTFNYYDKGKYSPHQALDVLNGYLLQRGYALVRRDRFLVCINTDNGIPPNLIPMVTAGELADRGNNELLTVIFPLENSDAAVVAPEVKDLLGPQGKVSVLKSANSVVVRDIGSNLKLLQRLFSAGSFRQAVVTASGPSFKTFELKHIRADDAERMIRNLFHLPQPTALSAATEDNEQDPGTISLTTEPRTNRLFVKAAGAEMLAIQQIAEALDIDHGTAANGSRTGRAIRVLPLGQSDVIIVSRALKSLTPRIQVSTTSSDRPTLTSGNAPPNQSEDGGSKPAQPATPLDRADGQGR
jgi:hypothetical protein